LRINGTAIAAGGIFQGNAPKAPGAGVSNGSLTDVETFDITSLLVPGQNSLHVTLDAGSDDAISAVVAAVDLPAGAAPPVPEPSTYLLMAAGVAVLLLSYRLKLVGSACQTFHIARFKCCQCLDREDALPEGCRATE
jgi:PEP-CTERM motif